MEIKFNEMIENRMAIKFINKIEFPYLQGIKVLHALDFRSK